jgi:hypothetical protein
MLFAPVLNIGHFSSYAEGQRLTSALFIGCRCPMHTSIRTRIRLAETQGSNEAATTPGSKPNKDPTLTNSGHAFSPVLASQAPTLKKASSLLQNLNHSMIS